MDWNASGTWAAVVVALGLALYPWVKKRFAHPKLTLDYKIDYPYVFTTSHLGGNPTLITLRVRVRNQGRQDAHDVKAFASWVWYEEDATTWSGVHLARRKLWWASDPPAPIDPLPPERLSVTIPKDEEDFLEVAAYETSPSLARILGQRGNPNDGCKDPHKFICLKIVVLSAESEALVKVLKFRFQAESPFVTELGFAKEPKASLYVDPLALEAFTPSQQD